MVRRWRLMEPGQAKATYLAAIDLLALYLWSLILWPSICGSLSLKDLPLWPFLCGFCFVARRLIPPGRSLTQGELRPRRRGRCLLRALVQLAVGFVFRASLLSVI